MLAFAVQQRADLAPHREVTLRQPALQRSIHAASTIPSPNPAGSLYVPVSRRKLEYGSKNLGVAVVRGSRFHFNSATVMLRWLSTGAVNLYGRFTHQGTDRIELGIYDSALPAQTRGGDT